MAKPTVAQTLNLARSLLGDDSISSGDVYTDAVLMPYIQSAHRKVFRAMGMGDNPYVVAESFYNLPANTRVLEPATAGLSDVGEILFVEERDVDSSVAVSGVAITSNVATVTTAAHGRAVGDTVVLFGFATGTPQPINGMWTISAVPSITEATLGGSYVSASSSTGTMSYSDSQFTDMDKVDVLGDVPISTSAGALGKWCWFGDRLYFPPSSEIRQLKITHTKSGSSIGANDTIDIDDAMDVIAYIAAGRAGKAHGDTQIGNDLLTEGLGPTHATDGRLGGLLYELIQQGVKAMQAIDWGRPPYGSPIHSSDELF